jgi:hypothetical protein
LTCPSKIGPDVELYFGLTMTQGGKDESTLLVFANLTIAGLNVGLRRKSAFRRLQEVLHDLALNMCAYQQTHLYETGY